MADVRLPTTGADRVVPVPVQVTKDDVTGQPVSAGVPSTQDTSRSCSPEPGAIVGAAGTVGEVLPRGHRKSLMPETAALEQIVQSLSDQRWAGGGFASRAPQARTW